MGVGHMNPNRMGGPKVFIPPEHMHGVCRDYHGACMLNLGGGGSRG
jgi:hypothetical protein